MTVQPGWILVAGIVLAVVFAIAGIVTAALAGLRFKRRLDALKKAQLAHYVPEAQAYVHRINTDLELMQTLLESAKASIDSINESLRELKMPQAILALRVAGAAVRLLISRG